MNYNVGDTIKTLESYGGSNAKATIVGKSWDDEYGRWMYDILYLKGQSPYYPSMTNTISSGWIMGRIDTIKPNKHIKKVTL